MRPSFWVETAISIVALVAAVLTVVWRDWIERLTGLNPDDAGGSVEWLIVATPLLASTTMALLARAEWRRAKAAAG